MAYYQDESAMTAEGVAKLIKENAALRATARTGAQVVAATVRWILKSLGIGLAYQVLVQGPAPWMSMEAVAHIVGWPVFVLVDILCLGLRAIPWVVTLVILGIAWAWGADQWQSWRWRVAARARKASKERQGDVLTGEIIQPESSGRHTAKIYRMRP